MTVEQIKYKQTGIEWMPQVPQHWDIVKLKYFSSLKARIGFHGLNSTDFFIDEGPYCITGTDFRNGQIEFIKRGTTINHLYERDFRNFYFPLSPKDEQDEIVQYIKAQEEKINLFIQKKKRFIELLKEQRQSVIDIAISKGINQNVKFIESGINWLSDVQKHWQIRKLTGTGNLIKNE